mgnify:CR=1 FL=1
MQSKRIILYLSCFLTTISFTVHSQIVRHYSFCNVYTQTGMVEGICELGKEYLLNNCVIFYKNICVIDTFSKVQDIIPLDDKIIAIKKVRYLDENFIEIKRQKDKKIIYDSIFIDSNNMIFYLGEIIFCIKNQYQYFKHTKGTDVLLYFENKKEYELKKYFSFYRYSSLQNGAYLFSRDSIPLDLIQKIEFVDASNYEKLICNEFSDYFYSQNDLNAKTEIVWINRSKKKKSIK